MIYIDKKRLDNFDRFQRGRLINCLTGTKPALLIATQSREGVNNLALFSNVFHLGADPSMIGFVQRPLTSYSHTYKNIIETGWFTVNHINESLAARAHHTSAKFPDGVSEFVACGIEEEMVEPIPVPFVKESAVRFAARFLREVFIDENNTRLVLANIESIHIKEGVLGKDGNIDFSLGNTVAVAGLEKYYNVASLATFAYAKVEKNAP